MPAVRNCPSTSSTWVLPRVCSTSSISTFCAASMVKARWWWTSSMLAPASATVAVMRASTPGTSRALTLMRARRPDQGLFDLQQHQHCLLDVALVHQHQVVHQALHDLLRDLAWRAHGNAFGDV